MTSWPLPQEVSSWALLLASVLDARQQQRFAALVSGALFATGRRTVTSWLRAAGITAEFRPCYSLLSGLARRVDELARLVLLRAALPVVAARGGRLLLALDDTPTKRSGPRVEGAGRHHNPTPGPAGQRFVYGHVRVTLALKSRAPALGRHRPAALGPALRPPDGRGRAAAVVRLAVPHQAGAGGRPGAVAVPLAAMDGPGVVAGVRRRLRQTAALAGGPSSGRGRRQPVAQGRRLAHRAAAPAGAAWPAGGVRAG